MAAGLRSPRSVWGGTHPLRAATLRIRWGRDMWILGQCVCGVPLSLHTRRRAVVRADTDRRGRRPRLSGRPGGSGHDDRRTRVPRRGVDPARGRLRRLTRRPFRGAARHLPTPGRSPNGRPPTPPGTGPRGWRTWASRGCAPTTPSSTSRGGSSTRDFFVGGLLNWADFAVDRWVREGRGEARAVWWEGDDGATLTLTYAELKAPRRRRRGRACGPAASARATSSRCCCRWSPRRSRPCSPRRRSARSSCRCSAGTARRPSATAWRTPARSCWSPATPSPGAVGRCRSRRWPTRPSATCPASAPSWSSAAWVPTCR